MLPASRHIPFRLLVALLALSVVAYPAAGAGAVAHCRAAKASTPAGDAVKSCCAKQAPAKGSSQGHDQHVPGSSKCAKCPHACCAPVVDVDRCSPNLIDDGEVVAAQVLPAESVHDPVTCDAIFHPPRA